MLSSFIVGTMLHEWGAFIVHWIDNNPFLLLSASNRAKWNWFSRTNVDDYVLTFCNFLCVCMHHLIYPPQYVENVQHCFVYFSDAGFIGFCMLYNSHSEGRRYIFFVYFSTIFSRQLTNMMWRVICNFNIYVIDCTITCSGNVRHG